MDLLIGVLAVIGAAFVVLAGIGVVRFHDVYSRMHAATKASTLGIAFIGIATILALDDRRAQVALAIAFIFVTAPSAAHFVARTAYRAEGVEVDLEGRDDLASIMDED